MAVRNESVRLSLQDDFTTGMAKAAASTALLRKELNDLSGTSVTSARSRALQQTGKDIDKVGTSARRASPEIDKFSGRLNLLVDAAAIATPAIVAIGAIGVPAISGLASQMGFAVAGIGAFVVGVQGLGDALEALNEARLEPTTENLAAAQIALEQLSPATQALAQQLIGLTDEWDRLRNVAGESLSPGLSAALDDLVRRGPDAERILQNINEAVSEMLADGAESLASPKWDQFFTFIATDAPPAIASLGRSLGNVASSMASLWQSFDPLNDSFAVWLEDTTEALERWSANLANTRGFEEFVAYVRETGPQVADTMGALAMAFIRIAEAAAPLGGPVLAALEGVANAVSMIADSDAGPTIMATVTALALLRRGMSTFTSISGTTWAKNIKGAETFGAKMQAARTPMLRGGAALAGVGLAASGLAGNFGLANTATGALTGAIAGPLGAAIGGAVGLFIDAAAASKDFEVNADSLRETLNQTTGAVTESTRVYAAQELASQGVLDAANELGLTLSDVTSAALGNEDAQARVNTALERQAEIAKQVAASQGESAVAGTGMGESIALVGEAVGIMNGQLSASQNEIALVGDAVGGAADAYERGSTAAQDFADTLVRVNEYLEGRASMRDYEAAIDDLTKSIKENGRTLDINGEKGRANEAALDRIGETAIRVAERLAGMDRARYLVQARQDFLDAAAKLDVGRKRAQEMADELGLLGRIEVSPGVVVDIRDGFAALDRARRELKALNGTRATSYIDIVTTYRRVGNATDALPRRAGGGEVPGQRFPYGDKTLILAAPGEEIISNRYGQADRFRADRAAGRIPAYASGGTIGPYAVAPSLMQRFADGGTVEPEKDKLTPSEQRRAAEAARKERERLRRMLRDFEVDITDGARDVRRELRDFARSYRDAGGKWTKALDQQAQVIIASARQYERQERRLNASAEASRAAADAQRDLAEQAQQAAETIRGSWVQLSEQVGGNFTSSLTGNGLRGLDKALRGDITGGTAMAEALQGLIAGGLDGGLLRELASSEDFKTAQQLLALGPAGIQQYEDLYAQRQAVNAGRGWLVADREYGVDMRYADAVAAAETARADQAEAHAAALEARLASFENRVVNELTLSRTANQDAPGQTGGAVAVAINSATAQSVVRSIKKGRGRR